MTVDPHSADLVTTADGLLRTFNDAGVLGAAEVQTAQRVTGLYRVADSVTDAEAVELVQLGIAMIIRALRAGSVCLDLTRASDLVLEHADDVDLPWPEPDRWWAALDASGLVDDAEAPDSGAPLRRRGPLLYAAKHFADEEVLRRWLQRSGHRVLDQPDALDDDALRRDLDELFDGHGLEPEEPDQQRLAAAVASLGSRLILAGGPGTGKTRTVARILAVLQAQHRRTGADTPLRIALAAPTGKAAARLTESIHQARADLPPVWRRHLDTVPEATTVHKLLGGVPGRGFRHGPENRLPHEVIVVDEMSMVSLGLMSSLLDALAPHTRLLCIGDPHQLASVEAGAVMADITAARTPLADTSRLASLASADHRFTELTPPVVELRRTFRFTAGIAAVADAIRAGDADATLAAFAAGHSDVTHLDLDAATAADAVLGALRQRIRQHNSVLIDAARAGRVDEALAHLDDHRVLCAHRDGPWGVSAWESRTRGWTRDLIDGGDGDWYAGLPLLNTANQYDTGLANGDTGVVVQTGAGLRAAFPIGATPTLFSGLVLDTARPMHAMTIHKSQGSQFDHVTVILPPTESPLLTRELLYTAVSRAKRHVTVIGPADAVRRAVERRANRASGLSS